MTDRLGQDVGMEEEGVLAQQGASTGVASTGVASTDTEMIAGLSFLPCHSSSFGVKTGDGVHMNLGHSSSSVVLGDHLDHAPSSLVVPAGELISPDDAHSSSDELSVLAHSPSILAEEAPQHALALHPEPKAYDQSDLV